MDNLRLYQVVNEEHHILVRASDEKDALYCAGEGWGEEIEGAEVSLVENPEAYVDLQIGTMRDLKA